MKVFTNNTMPNAFFYAGLVLAVFLIIALIANQSYGRGKSEHTEHAEHAEHPERTSTPNPHFKTA